VLPIFGALPFVFGAMTAEGDGARFVDAFFEAMSGLTTTGPRRSTGLDALPVGSTCGAACCNGSAASGSSSWPWCSCRNCAWAACRSSAPKAFDTMGKILPRATEIAARISVIYLALTIVCGLTYGALGMPGFDALMHALTTISTGGFSKPRRRPSGSTRARWNTSRWSS
jgi:trk system potassium uptake protein TrkH